MASTSSVSLALLPAASSIARRPLLAFSPIAMPCRSHKINKNRFVVRASSSLKEQAAVGLAAAAMAAAFLAPDMAEAAQPGISPSLGNFLLSIASGGVVLGAIIGAVVGVSNFDPVKRA